ncbi:MAG: hypothetical protein EOP22_09230 [Hyphomicrobiales bacterium]|nr:MAG: hypothetical protein EOP22_09230 [Hyphomicrobiales bacterium]
MEISAEDVEAFMQGYAEAMDSGVKSGKPDGKLIACHFAADLIAASPAGIQAASSKGLAAVVEQGIASYRAMGGAAFVAEAIAIEELAPTSFMASVGWRFDYKRPKDGKEGSVSFTNRYFVNSADGSPKIFAWITPDEQAALKQHGLA